MLVALGSHTVDVDLLPDRPVVLDVGCRGFDFVRSIWQYRPGARIFGMDAAPDVKCEEAIVFIQGALIGDERETALLAHHSTGEGDFISDDPPWYAARFTVQCWRIQDIMRRHGISHWDLVKLDCEGSEYGILENWPGPIATQLSVEFHDWTGPWQHYVAGDYYERLFAGPLKDYEVVQHDLSRQGEGIGHWDSVFRLRS